MTTFERDGERWDTRAHAYGRYDGEPCTIIEMRGNIDRYCGDAGRVLQAQTLEDDWARYWIADTDPAVAATLAAIVHAQERSE